MINFEILTGRTDSHLTRIIINNYEIQIYPNIEKDLRTWESLAQKNGIDFAVASAYRSYERQLLIWNEKVQGKRPIRDAQDNIINIQKLNETELLNAILIWSHIPGVSRHHWGTDLDVFDAAWFKLHNEKLELCNEIYLNQGPCAKFHLFNEELSHHSMPFYRPYNDMKNFMKELWHYSHLSSVVEFEKEYTFKIFIKNLEQSPHLELRSLLLKNADYYFQKFVALS